MKRTEHYDLPKWEKTDRIMMDDFNDMTAKLDAALAAGTKFAAGTYRGTGDINQPTQVSVGFTPSAVLISAAGTSLDSASVLITQDAPLQLDASNALAKITDGGFTVRVIKSSTTIVSPNMNADRTFCYIAFK